MSDITKQMCSNREEGRGYCLSPANHEEDCVFPKPVNRSEMERATQIANELGAAEMLQGPYLDAVPVIARSLTTYSLALTAAVRREDAEIARSHTPSGHHSRAVQDVLALITPDQQSALDAYRDSVLAKQVSPLLKLLELIEGEGYCGNFQSELRAALKGSSGADRKEP